MENDVKKELSPNLNFSILPTETKKALDFLAEQLWLKKSWYLAGGTALALSTGLRKSVDLDFFCENKDFENKELLSKFIGNKNWETKINKENTVYGELFRAKVSFIAYPFFVPAQEMINYGAVRILRPLDIAVMKIVAISQRGKKRDFFDLFWCCQNLESLEDLMKRTKKQYPSVAHDYHHILKSLVYFEDAQGDPDPELNSQISWKKVKDFFNKEVFKLTKNLIS